MARRVAAVGVSDPVCVRKREDATFFQMIYDAAKEALEDAGVGIKDIDSVHVGTASDLFNRQILPPSYFAEAIGLTQKPLCVNQNMGGSTPVAVIGGAREIMVGDAELVLVIAGDGPSVADVPGLPGFQAIITHANDYIWDFPLGFMAISIFAIMVQFYMSKFGITEKQAALVPVKNHGNALLNPKAQSPRKLTVEDVMKSPMIAYPTKFLDCCVVTDAWVALVLASEERAKKLRKPPIWLDGYSYAVDVQKFGWREVMSPGAKFHAPQTVITSAQKAYNMAGITNPRKEIDVVEIQDAYSMLELLTYELLGFCEEGQGGRFIEAGITKLSGELPVNTSGGCMGHGHPIGGVGLLQTSSIIRQLRGECGDYQVDPLPKTGLVETMGGPALSVAGVTIWRR